MTTRKASGEKKGACNDVARVALEGSVQLAFWLDNPARPAARPACSGEESCDLAVVGAGFTGLWTALLAKERHPDKDVLVLDAGRIAGAASGRNGGFCSASLTHGEANGRERFAAEYDRLAELGLENLDEIGHFVSSEGIECGFERTGELDVATEPYQVALLAAHGGELLDREAVRAEVSSPTYLAGTWDKKGAAMVDPARLAWGLAAACEARGIKIAENTEVTALEKRAAGLALSTRRGTISARQVALGSNAFRPLLGRLRLYIAPVYDYVLVTEPLSSRQREAIGWRNRQGIGDGGNQFHYYRLTEDGRILWGGYDAIYHFGRQVRESYDERPASFAKLAGHFFGTFPQLEGMRFTHRWGGAIDTCTRFCAFYGSAYDNRLAYSLGYTGLGVGASRFGAKVILDLLDGERSELLRLQMVRKRPLPFPPEPFSYFAIQATRRALAAADRHEGRRNIWLRSLDRLGVGFDS